MKNLKYLMMCVLATIAFQAGAQSLKEMKKMVKESASTKPDTTGLKQVTVSGGENQYTMAEAFMNSGKKYFSYKIYRTSGKNTGTILGQYPIQSTQFFNEIKRNDANQIISFDGYTPNESAFPLYYFNSGKCLYFVGEYAFEFRRYFPTADDVQKAADENSMDVVIYGADKSKVKKLTQADVRDMMKKYLSEASKGLSEVRANEKAAAAKADAEKRARYSIKGKEVSKIRIELSDALLKQGNTYTVTVIATLKDGSEISTANGGFADDYEMTVSGIAATYENMGFNMNTVNLTTFSIPDKSIVTGDKVLITVKSKYHSTISATLSKNMDYNINYDINYNGSSSYMRGGDSRIEIKQVKNAVNGEALLEYKIFGAKDNNLLRHFRISKTGSVNFSVCGFNAFSGDNGTDGGNVTVIIDPGVTGYILNIRNTGGRGGKAGNGKPPGYPGRDGKVEKLNQKVTW